MRQTTQSGTRQPHRHIGARRTEYRFGPFRLQTPHGPFWHHEQPVKLQRKALVVLTTLVRQFDQVVTREALLDAAWPNVVVGDDALEYQIRMLRRTLGDSARQPDYIETVHGIGFRFIAEVTTHATDRQPHQLKRRASDTFQSRARKLGALESAYIQALRGQRQMVFITGPAGIGKAALVETFRRGLDPRSLFMLHCRFSRRSGNAPGCHALRRALQTLGRSDNTGHVGPLLQEYLAPLAHRQITGADDTARVLIHAMEALASRHPLLLFLESLHHGDAGMRMLLHMLAHNRQPAHMLVVATYSPAEDTTYPDRDQWLRGLKSSNGFVQITLANSTA